MYPSVTRGYGIRITSTPNDKLGMFYRLWAGDSRFSRHKVTIHDAARQGMDVDIDMLIAGIADPESWAQEYECQFLDEATAYLTYEMITECEDPSATIEMPTSMGGELYLGVDVGRKHDLTVFWLLERVGDVLWTRVLREMKNVLFSVQRDYLYSLLERTGVRRVCIDASGIGAQMSEEALKKFGPRVEAVTFTAPVKEDMAITVRRHFEDRTLRIPADKHLREDLHSLRRTYTEAGNIRFDAARRGGSHADRFWALALALTAANAPRPDVRYESLNQRERSRGQGCW
jgi:phage FluMu gp28-like protein